MKKILVFGSLNIDIVYSLDHIVRPGETILSSSIEKNAGGKGLNQACAISKTGLDVYMAGCVGEDGDMLIDTLSSFGVNVDNVKRLDVPTGNAIIERSRDGQNSIILFAGANRAIDETLIDCVLASFSTGDIIVLQNEINGLSEIIKKASEKGMYVVFNPAPFDESVFSLPLENVNLLVVNEIEGAGVAGKGDDATYEEILDALKDKYRDNEVIMTCGKNGSYWQKGDKRIFEKARMTKRNTTRQIVYNSVPFHSKERAHQFHLMSLPYFIVFLLLKDFFSFRNTTCRSLSCYSDRRSDGSIFHCIFCIIPHLS